MNVDYSKVEVHGYLPWEVDNEVSAFMHTYEFFDYLKEHSVLNVEMEWNVGLLTYLKIIDENEPLIHVSIPGVTNAHVSFGAYGYVSKTPFTFRMWKYIRGKHFSENIDLPFLDNKDFSMLLDKMLLFYGLRSHKPIQLSLFDFSF